MKAQVMQGSGIN